MISGMRLQFTNLHLPAVIIISMLVTACTSTSGRTRSSTAGPSCKAGQVMVCDGGTGSSVSDMSRRDPAFCSCRPASQIDK